MADPELERRARKVLAEASILAEAPGVSFIPSGVHAHETKDPTTATGMNLYDRIVRRLRTDRSLRRAVEWAEAQLEAARVGPPVPVLNTKQQVLSQFGGDHYLKVADIVGLHGTTVWRWRVAAGLRGVDGTDPLEDAA